MSDAHDASPRRNQCGAQSDDRYTRPNHKEENANPSRHPTTKLEESQVFEDQDHQTKGQDMPNQDTQAQEHHREKDIRSCFRVVPSNPPLEERVRNALSREKADVDWEEIAINTASLYQHNDWSQQCIEHPNSPSDLTVLQSRDKNIKVKRDGFYLRSHLTRQQEKAQATRERLLDSTFECLVERGYDGMTTVAVCKHSGLARGTMLHHYPTKDALVIASLEYILIRRVRHFEEVLTRAGKIDLETVRDVRTYGRRSKVRPFRLGLSLRVASRTHPDLALEFHSVMKRFDERVQNFVDRHLSHLKPVGMDMSLLVGIGFSALNGLALDLLQMSETEADAKFEILLRLALQAAAIMTPA